jgi:hypothetical protein
MDYTLTYRLYRAIAIPLTIIFRNSMATGMLPREWKGAVVVPIYKKGDKSDPGNYRPVSLTSIRCKIMEKIVRESLIDYLRANNLISNRQFGFWSQRSTTLQLLLMLETWSEDLDRNG